MNAATWISLFRHIPPDQQSQFTLITSNGTELTVQNFIRIEPEFLLVKGRLAASQDSGRVFFIPYAMIDSFSYTNPVRDTDVEELFGKLTFDAPAAGPLSPAAPSAMVPQPTRTSNQGQTPAPSPSRLNIRSEVLERFRNSRTGTSSLNLPRPQLDEG